MTQSNSNSQLNPPIKPKGVRKIRTLIEGFDEITHGGLPMGRTDV